MMKSMVLATNFGKANEMNLCEKEMGFLVRDKDYQTISDRLSEMEPMEASRWLAMQDEHLRFSVACLMAPEKAKKICEGENQAAETGYLKTGVFSLAKSRIFWLMALMISGMITGTILARYESAFATVPMLVTFIPMLTDTGGNAGSQSSTMVIRAMAMGEINIRNLLRIGIAHRRYQTNLTNLIQQGFVLNRRNRLNLTPQIPQTNSCTEQGKDDNNHIKEIRQKL